MSEQVHFNALAEHYHQGVMRAHEHWVNKNLADVRAEMPTATTVNISGDRQARPVEILPEYGLHDETETIVLGLPFLNGLSPHQYMRAKTLQQLVNPEARVIVLPNNSTKDSAYTLNNADRKRLAQGDATPLGELWVDTLERLDTKRSLGALSLTGYSQGGLTVLAMGAVGSDRLHFNVVNADEVPSKSGRTDKQLKKDFMTGGMFDVPQEAKEADIDALSQAMNKPRFILDVMRFYAQSKRRDSKLIQHAMSGDIDKILWSTLENGVPVKLGRVEGSPMFDLNSINPARNARQVTYEGGLGHAAGDNVIKHALMAQDGLRSAA